MDATQKVGDTVKDKTYQTLHVRPWIPGYSLRHKVIAKKLEGSTSPEGRIIQLLEQMEGLIMKTPTDLLGDVIEFHNKMELSYDGPPRHPGPERLKYLLEEVEEMSSAYLAEDLHEALDALIDLIYFALGTVDLMGLSPVFYEAWGRVHAANMMKKQCGDPKKGKTGVVKPKGWEPPYLEDLVESD